LEWNNHDFDSSVLHETGNYLYDQSGIFWEAGPNLGDYFTEKAIEQINSDYSTKRDGNPYGTGTEDFLKPDFRKPCKQ
jgi:hypothetical protein